jgi:hypothetical protein
MEGSLFETLASLGTLGVIIGIGIFILFVQKFGIGFSPKHIAWTATIFILILLIISAKKGSMFF